MEQADNGVAACGSTELAEVLRQVAAPVTNLSPQPARDRHATARSAAATLTNATIIPNDGVSEEGQQRSLFSLKPGVSEEIGKYHVIFQGVCKNMRNSSTRSGILPLPVARSLEVGSEIENRKSKMRARAREIGLPAIGVAAAGPTEHTDAFEAWLASGRAADLDYLRRHAELRRDPRALFPAARSLVIAALPYPVNPAPAAGGFAMLARGRDYHLVLRARLGAFAQRLAADMAVLRWRVCVDSAPLAERTWAVRAGLGWIGRQGQFVHPEYGATVVLGALLLNVALPPDAPHPNRCGDCRRCLDACPTGALAGDGTLDCRRCLSYLTIEHKAAVFDLPDAARVGAQHAWFGCDRCTAVCPWNHAPPAAIPSEFLPSMPPSADAILALDEAAFAARFAATTVLRTGLARLLRNVRAGKRPSGATN